MSRAVPMAACLALLKAFDQAAYENTEPTAQQAIAAAGAAVETIVGEAAMADLNAGQFAALIDFYLWKDEAVFTASDIVEWATGGNLSKVARELPSYGPRGKAERDMWNVGAEA